MAIDKIGTNGLVASAIVPPDGTITTAKLANDAVTSAKIGVDVIAAEDLANNSITAAEITNGAVTAAKLASGMILQVQSSSDNLASASPSTVSHDGSSASALYGTGRANRTYSLATTVNITPISTSSKLLCFGTIKWTAPTVPHSTGAIIGVITLNDTSAIDSGDYPFYAYTTTLGGGYPPPTTWSGVFSPNSTSQQVIRLRPAAYSEANNTFTTQWRGYSLVVMEIAG